MSNILSTPRTEAAQPQLSVTEQIQGPEGLEFRPLEQGFHWGIEASRATRHRTLASFLQYNTVRPLVLVILVLLGGVKRSEPCALRKHTT